MQDQANSFKFSTIIFLVLGLILPLWPITLPLFWFLAYRSYKSGGAPSGYGASATANGMSGNTGRSPAEDLAHWKKLLDDGAITRDEFDQQKRRLLGS